MNFFSPIKANIHIKKKHLFTKEENKYLGLEQHKMVLK